ncbi:hypothetical protein PV327_005634 [Microctonus hyperodae]|uniref:Amidase domain-containing protein n=1 Tax=Microctonus hyperodae TaxID=165561 RepID=A0AA39G233_MICHY|nr:hypothetical protein PV327_005634 [Microctonus hyperodae]
MDKRLMNFLGNFFSVIHRLIEFVGRWIFLLAAYLTGPPEMPPPIENKNITMLSLNELSIMIRQKKISSEDAVKAYIDRIKKIQPIVNCMTEDRFEEALKEARQCDAILNSPDAPSTAILEKNKPFFGVPFTTKDCIAIKGMKQTAGLVLRREIRSDKDAEAIKLIREAGAIPLATTNISELAMWWESNDGGQFFITPVSPDIKQAMNKVISYLTWGHKIKVEKVKIKKLKKSLALWFANMASPKDKDFAYELANRNGRINVWWEFIKWITFTSHYTLIGLITATFEIFGIQYDSEIRTKLVQESRDLYQEFRDMLGEDGVFLYPTHPTPAPLHHEPLIKPLNFSYTAIINCLGLPATACPLGFSNGLPIGVQVVAGLYQDHLTLAVAEELERNFGGWQPPELNNQIESNDHQLIDSKSQ